MVQTTNRRDMPGYVHRDSPGGAHPRLLSWMAHLYV